MEEKEKILDELGNIKENLEKDNEDLKNNIEEIKVENNKKLEDMTNELNNTKKILEEKEKELNEIMIIKENLQKDNENYKIKIEEMKVNNEKEKESNSIFSNDKTIGLISDKVNNIFTSEFSVSLNEAVEDIIINFNLYSKYIFGTSESGCQYAHYEDNLYLYILKDIYFYIYFYVFNLKSNNNEQDKNMNILISSNDFSVEIIEVLSEEIYKRNIICLTNNNSQKKIDLYMNELKNLGINGEILKRIEKEYKIKNEKMRLSLLNLIKSLVRKCADTIKNSAIEINNKKLYDFKIYTGEELSYNQNTLQITCDKLTNEKIEIVINILKHPPKKINRIHFLNEFNRDISEYNIQKILLNIMNYNADIKVLRFHNYENFSTNLISYIMFLIQNLKNIKILSLESCNLNDNHIKIITEGIKTNRCIIALMLRKNSITSRGAIYISELLKVNSTIKQLFLGYNKINDKGLASILKVISATNKKINHLDISCNYFKLKDFQVLIEYLKTNPELSLLDISDNRLDSQSCTSLGEVLNTVNKIKSLNVSNMGINTENIPILFKSLCMTEIILDDNDIGDEGLPLLIKIFGENQNLKKLSLKNTKLSGKGLDNLLKVLEKMNDFKELHLENNNIDESGIRDMMNATEGKQFKVFVSKEEEM